MNDELLLRAASMAYRFIPTMRWFGPSDPVSLSDIRQAGCEGVVTALHHIPNGAVWPVSEILKRKSEIEAAGMVWSVVESVPVHESIKTRSGNFRSHIENYRQTLLNLGDCGIRIVTYNFMPLLDWTRTDLDYALPDGSRVLRFERAAFIAFDVFWLKRPDARSAYRPEEIHRAEQRWAGMSDDDKKTLERNIVAGLPGAEENYSIYQLREALQTYEEIDRATLRRHLTGFLQEILPAAEEAGVVLALHPDDPPYSLLGLPRVVGSAEDLSAIFAEAPSPANGLCFCTGSLGAGVRNDLPAIAKQFADRIHFIHLRNIRRDNWGDSLEGDFLESPHLDGDVDMFEVMRTLLTSIRERQISIPMRPDHGARALDDLHKKTNPGYSAIGRLKGLAELRGLEMGILRSLAVS